MEKKPQDVRVHPLKEDTGPDVLIFEFRRLGISARNEERLHIGPHMHEEYELIIADTGLYGCAVNDEWMTLEPGEGILIKPGDIHEDKFEKPAQYFATAFSLRSTRFNEQQVMIFPKDNSSLTQRFSLGVEKHQGLLLQYQEAQDESGDFIGQLQDSLLSLFIWSVIRALDPEALDPAFYEMSQTQTFPNRLHRVLRRHIHNQVIVSDIAEEMNMSESALAHTCKELLGISPYKAFITLKMERARHYLEKSDWIIKEIANDLGFADQYSFSRTFKNHFGASPVNWRKENKSMRQ